MKLGFKLTVVRLDRPLWMTASNMFINLVLLAGIFVVANRLPDTLMWNIISGALTGVLIALLVKKQWQYYPETSTILDETIETQRGEEYSVRAAFLKDDNINDQ